MTAVSGARSSYRDALIPALLVSLVPLGMLPGAFAPFHAAKWLLVLVLVPCGLVSCAIKGTLRWPLRNWFLVWLGVSALSTVLGVAPWMSVFGSPNRNAGLLAMLVGTGAFVLGASTGDSGTVQRIVLRAAMLAGGLVGLIAILQRVGLDPLGTDPLHNSTRTGSTWGSATFAGAHFILVLPIAVAHLRSRDPRWRIAALVCTASMALGLLLTGTRGAWLAALVVAIVMYPSWRRGSQEGTTPVPIAIRVGLVAVVVAGAAALVVPNLGRSSGVGRIDLWRTSSSVIAERPLLGSGPDTQRVVLPSGISESFEQKHGSDELHDRVHNIVLDSLVTTGLIGTLAFGALLFAIARLVIKRTEGELVPSALTAGLVGYLVTLLFAFGDPAIDPIAWLLAGILVASTPSGHRGEEGNSSPIHQSRPVRISGAVMLGISALAGAFWAGGEVVAEYHLETAMESRARGDLQAALNSISGAADRAPTRFDLDQLAARIITESIIAGSPAVAGDSSLGGTSVDDSVEQAMEYLSEAGRLTGEDPDILMDRAELLTAAERPNEAVDLYGEIFDIYPQSFRAHLGLGLAESQLNHLKRAERAWKRAAKLGPEDPRAEVNLGILYERGGDPDAALEAYRSALKIDSDAPGARAGVERVTNPGRR